MKPTERRSIDVGFQLRSVAEDGSIEGYGSVFDTPDCYGDIVAKGAFKVSLADHKTNGTMPAMLWQHDSDEPIGVWNEMLEDSKGLLVKGRIALDTTTGKDAHALLKIGAVTGLSIGFYPVQWTYNADTDVRTLTEIDLWECSPVTFPANPKARVTTVKSAADEIVLPKDAERILREAGFGKVDATAFVSHVMRLGEKRRDAEQFRKAQQAANNLLKSLFN